MCFVLKCVLSWLRTNQWIRDPPVVKHGCKIPYFIDYLPVLKPPFIICGLQDMVPSVAYVPGSSHRWGFPIAILWWPENKSLYWLVVLSILKNMSSSMGRIIPYITENKKKMFETTNQLYLWWNVPMFFFFFSYFFFFLFPLFSHDFSHDFPMIFPFSHDFPMIFPWFSHDFPSKLNLHMAPSSGISQGTAPQPGAWSSLPRAAANCSSMLRCIASQSWRRRAPDPWDVEQTMGFYIVFMYFWWIE